MNSSDLLIPHHEALCHPLTEILTGQKRATEDSGSKKESKHSRIHPQWFGKRANPHRTHHHHLYDFMAKARVKVELSRLGKSTPTEHQIPNVRPL